MDTISRRAWIVLVVTLLAFVATATAATGIIQVTVHPGGGTVCLDTDCREGRGTTDTPGTTVFDGVEAGRYHMLNVYGTPGYKPYWGQLFFDPSGTSLARDIYLEPLPPQPIETGTLQVFITPDGGKACLDRMCEMSSGDSTGSWSVQFTDVVANTYHTLTIANEGNETCTREIRLLPGETKTMTLTLLPLPPGSTTPPAPQLQPTTEPQPTPAADLPVSIVLLATGICGIGMALTRSGRD